MKQQLKQISEKPKSLRPPCLCCLVKKISGTQFTGSNTTFTFVSPNTVCIYVESSFSLHTVFEQAWLRPLPYPCKVNHYTPTLTFLEALRSSRGSTLKNKTFYRPLCLNLPPPSPSFHSCAFLYLSIKGFYPRPLFSLYTVFQKPLH